MSHVRHLLLPGFENARCPLSDEQETIAALLDRTEWQFKLPTICVLNGVPVMRGDWATTTVSTRDNVVFYSKPHGSGGSGGDKTRTIVGLVAMVALAVFAPYAAGTLLGLAVGTFAYTATVAAITLAGGFLVSTFLSAKAASNDDEQIAQVYSLSAAGNTASPFQSIPVQYGRLKCEPNYASLPWTEFVGNDAYLNVLLALGQGKYQLEQILIDDTVLWDRDTGFSGVFSNVTFQQADPNTPFTLFPANVVQSSEVNGQEVTDTPLGYFIVNNAGTTITDIAFDFVFPAGLRHTNDDGKHTVQGMNLYIFVQQVNDLGEPISGEIPIYNPQMIIMNTPQPQRITYRWGLTDLGLPHGRYQAKVFRSPTTSTDTDHVQDQLQWAGLRGFLAGSNTYPNCSVLGIRMMASAQLSQNSAKKIGVVQTRILPIWNGVDMVEAATQNAWWAFWDAATNQAYGLEWPTDKIDFQTIVDQANAADVRGDTFNYRFESAVTFQQAFDTILSSNRAKSTWLGDVLSATRDEWVPIPEMLISDQQIIRGTAQVDYILNSEDSSDCVQLRFLNEDTWQPAMLQYPPNSPPTFIAQNPAALDIPGITKPSQVFNELKFFWKQSQMRRIKIRLDTEHDGRLLRFGSAVKIQSYLPRKWGASGEVVSYNSTTKVVTINRKDLDTTEAGQHYIEFRSKVGGYFGPIKATFHITADQIQLDPTDLATVESDQGITIEDALDRMDGAEPPAFVWGLASNLARNCIVLSGKPSGDKVSLECVVDTEAVHDDTGDTQPPFPQPPPYADPRAPVISGLVATFKTGVAEPQLSATWWPAKGAIYYRAQVSYDGGTSWTTIIDSTTDPQFTQVVAWSDLKLRVAAVGYLQGPWQTIDVTAPDATLTIGAGDLEQGLQDYVMNQLKAVGETVNKVLQQIASVAAETDASQTKNAQTLRVVSSNAFAQVTNLAAVVATNTEAFATYQTTVNAHLGDLDSSVTTNATAIATVNGVVSAQFTLTLDVNGNVSGFQSTNDGATSTFRVLADNFTVAKPGISGGAPINVFSVGTVGGVASVGLSGNMWLDGVLTARMIQAGSITGDRIATDTLTATNIQAGAINTSELAVNSVSLDNIIAGAVSNTAQYGSSGFGPSPANTVVFTGTHLVRSGRMTIRYSDEWATPGISYGGARPQPQVFFYVDGSPVRSFTFTMVPFGPANFYELFQPFNLEFTVGGLSDGVHSVTVQIVPNGANVVVTGGQVYLTDFRR